MLPRRGLGGSYGLPDDPILQFLDLDRPTPLEALRELSMLPNGAIEIGLDAIEAAAEVVDSLEQALDSRLRAALGEVEPRGDEAADSRGERPHQRWPGSCARLREAGQ